LIEKPDIDGFFVGEASLKPEFKTMVEITNGACKKKMFPNK
jgi:triosephosphate isomerase